MKRTRPSPSKMPKTGKAGAPVAPKLPLASRPAKLPKSKVSGA